jgi:hypothetical protein
MNYNFDELLARLANGESAENIANEMTAMLNRAIQEQEALNAEKQKETQKKEEFMTAFNAMTAFIQKWYPDLAKELTEDVDFTDDEVCKIAFNVLDELSAYVEAIADLVVSSQELRKKLNDIKPASAAKPIVATPTPKSDEEILADFIKALNL